MIDPETQSRGRPGLLAIADVFARYGNFTLGGGSATVGTLHRELLDRRRWIDADAFTLCFSLARLTPGTNVLAFCTGIGWLLRGFPGAIVALLAASVPCTLIVAVATALFTEAEGNGLAQAAIHGAIAAAVAITVKTCWTIAHPHYRRGSRLRVVVIATAAFLLYVVANVPAIEVLLGAAVLGTILPPVRA